MSVEAISWAFQQPVAHASAKFVLVAMANHADAEMRCWPSSAHLCSQTSQDRKTVQANLARLREWGYIEDTGERRGVTKQVIVYQLKQPNNGPVYDDNPGPDFDENQAQISPNNSTENGLVKQAQKRNSTENGTGPNFPIKRPVFPHKQAQISPETGPKTGHGTVRNHQEPSGTTVEGTTGRAKRISKGWEPSPEDLEFCRTNRADLDPQVTADRFRDYWLAQSGPRAAKLDWPATWRNWVRNERRPQNWQTPARETAQDRAQKLADRLNGKNRPHEPASQDFIDINDRPAGAGG